MDSFTVLPSGSRHGDYLGCDDKGYHYSILNKTNNGTITWRCNYHSRNYRCLAVVTEINGKFYPGKYLHDHPPPKKRKRDEDDDLESKSNKKKSRQIEFYEDKDSDSYELIKNGTSRGGDLLVSKEGYCYTLKSVAEKYIKWICNTRRKFIPCNALLKQVGSKKFLLSSISHNHEPDVSFAVNAKLGIILKQKLWDKSYYNCSTTKIIKDSIKQLPPSEQKVLGNFTSIRRKFNRYRQDQVILENMALNLEQDSSGFLEDDCTENDARPDTSDLSLLNYQQNKSIAVKSAEDYEIIEGGGANGVDLLVTKEGYCYHRAPDNHYGSGRGSILWECNVREQKKNLKAHSFRLSSHICGAIVWQRENTFRIGPRQHKHAADPRVPATAIFMAKMKRYIQNNTYNEKNANVLIQNAIDELDSSQRKLIPARETIKLLIRRLYNVDTQDHSNAIDDEEEQFEDILSEYQKSLISNKPMNDLAGDLQVIHVIYDQSSSSVSSRIQMELFDDSLIGYDQQKQMSLFNRLMNWGDEHYKIYEDTGMNASDLLATQDGYLYIKSSSTSHSVQWTCVKTSCQNIVLQQEDTFLTLNESHNHSPSIPTILKVQFIKMMKEKSQDPDLLGISVEDILKLCLSEEPLESILPHTFMLLQILKYFRNSRLNQYPSIQEIKNEELEDYRPDDLDLEDFESDQNDIPKNIKPDHLYKNNMKVNVEIKPSIENIEEEMGRDLVDNCLDVLNADVLDLPESLTMINSIEITCELMCNARGNPFLITNNGFRYNCIKNSIHPVTKWICFEKSRHSCAAYVNQYGDSYQQSVEGHSHPSSIKSTIKSKCYNIIKNTLIKDIDMEIDAVICEIFREIGPLYQRFVPKISCLRFYISRYKSNPESLHTFRLFKSNMKSEELPQKYNNNSYLFSGSSLKDEFDYVTDEGDIYEILNYDGQEILITNTGNIFKREKTKTLKYKKWICALKLKRCKKCRAIIKQYKDVFDKGKYNHNHVVSRSTMVRVKYLCKLNQQLKENGNVKRNDIVRNVMKEFPVTDWKFIPTFKSIYTLIDLNKEESNFVLDMNIDDDKEEFNYDKSLLIGPNYSHDSSGDERDPLEERYEILKTCKGKSLLTCNTGYVYHFKSSADVFVKWVCGGGRRKDQKKCKAILRQYDNIFEPGTQAHSHEPSLREVVRVKLLHKLRENIKLIKVMPKTDVVKYSINQLPRYHRKYIPTFLNLTRTFNRYLENFYRENPEVQSEVENMSELCNVNERDCSEEEEDDVIETFVEEIEEENFKSELKDEPLSDNEIESTVEVNGSPVIGSLDVLGLSDEESKFDAEIFEEFSDSICDFSAPNELAYNSLENLDEGLIIEDSLICSKTVDDSFSSLLF